LTLIVSVGVVSALAAVEWQRPHPLQITFFSQKRPDKQSAEKDEEDGNRDDTVDGDAIDVGNDFFFHNSISWLPWSRRVQQPVPFAGAAWVPPSKLP